MTRTPRLVASSTVRSVEPLSTTRISSTQRRLSMARTMLRSSLHAMMVAVIFIRRASEPGRGDRRQGEAEQENYQRQVSHFLADRAQVGRGLDGRVAHSRAKNPV